MIKKYNIYKTKNIYFFYKQFLIIKNNNNLWFVDYYDNMRNNSEFFIKKISSKKNLIKLFGYKYFKNFFIFLFSMNSLKFYYFRIRIRGLGFRLKRIYKNILKLVLNRRYFLYIYLPDFLICKKKFRHIIFIGLNKQQLNLFIKNISDVVGKDIYKPYKYGFF